MTNLVSRRQFIIGSTTVLGASCFPSAWSSTSVSELPIPPLVDGADGETVYLKIQHGKWRFLTDVYTHTLGFSQDYLGPTIRTRKDTTLNLHYENTLEVPVAVHGHGLHVPGVVDGGPQSQIAPQGSWRPSLSIAQPAATCWYHSHTHGSTGEQVYRGLAGMMIIDDDHSDSLTLPNQYGVDDLPIIIQDRTFDSSGQLVYSLGDAPEDGWFGETVVVNGAIAPTARVPAGKIRLRLLNGANARFYILQFADKRTFKKIASDGGYLEAPVLLTSIEMAPGERCEIVVDMEDGNPAELLALFEDEFDPEGIIDSVLDLVGLFSPDLPSAALTLVVDSSLSANTQLVADKLNTIIRPDDDDIAVTREFLLEVDGQSDGHHGMSMTINGSAMDMSIINERITLGQWERWRVMSDQGVHPFHVHGCSFLVETIGGETVAPAERGWKDVVVADDDDWTEFLVRFDYPATDDHPYMYHCHILEHEDMGMMGQFTVS